jgi:Flp pilus assembly protein TadD
LQRLSESLTRRIGITSNNPLMDREHRVAAEQGKLDSTEPAADDLAAVLNAVLGEMRAGKFLEAQMLCRQLLERSPDNPEILHLMALVCFNAGQFDHAVEWASRALRNDAKPAYLTTLGTALLNLGRRDDAVRVFDKAVQLKPDDATLWSNLAHALIESGRIPDALLCRARAHQLDPQNPKIRNELGHGFMLLGRHEEALSWFDRALEIRPDAVETLNNKAFSLARLHRFDEAFAVYARSKAAAPDNAWTDFNVALLQMLTGSFTAGWLGREARLRLQPYPDFRQPRWFGDQDIAGKTILLYADEGLGDSIQFIRYVPMVTARGARVALVVEEALCALLASLPGVAECVSKQAALPTFDLHCPISSLPLVFNTTLETIPASASYLPQPAEDRVRRWEERLGPHQTLRVGLVWSGNPRHINDRDRSIRLREMLPILEVGATFVSLQKDPRPGDKVTLAGTRIIDWTSELADFVETAALVSCLDLVITVDTSVAHLAAALGRPTWILLPHAPDYRWLLGRDDSPWYPTVHLFRQSESRDYADVVARIRAVLAELAAECSPGRPAE